MHLPANWRRQITKQWASPCPGKAWPRPARILVYARAPIAYHHYGKNPYLPCVLLFAVCFLSGTRQRATLPCATTKTPGLKNTHGKFMLCRVLFFWHTTKSIVCRVPKKSTRQSINLPCVFSAHGKRIIFFLFPIRNFLYSLHITCGTSYSNLIYFCICLLYLTK